MSVLLRVAGIHIRKSKDLEHPEGALSTAVKYQFGHLIRMSHGQFALEVFQAFPTGRKTQGGTQNPLDRLYISSGLGKLP